MKIQQKEKFRRLFSHSSVVCLYVLHNSIPNNLNYSHLPMQNRTEILNELLNENHCRVKTIMKSLTELQSGAEYRVCGINPWIRTDQQLCKYPLGKKRLPIRFSTANVVYFIQIKQPLKEFGRKFYSTFCAYKLTTYSEMSPIIKNIVRLTALGKILARVNGINERVLKTVHS